MTDGGTSQGDAKELRAIRAAVVSHHTTDGHPARAKPRERSCHKRDRRLPILRLEYFGVRDAAVIVNRYMHVLAADAAPHLPAVAMDPVADPRDAH